ncbi:Phosphatidylserine synthase [Reticulomyxa filosa]|uniref:Phosphatidylserine synthase n=1 Tax=Reticulomyxa filosa TaxID=46433 RepID=X6MQ38_RETFI|nr:Phosphatidylserine synthase [Reticulomyxa filosa]|eukprot:ETO15547.1 Phosphatidylserine synthase [Reticulomyxa filosa]
MSRKKPNGSDKEVLPATHQRRSPNFHDNAPVVDVEVPWLYETHSVTLLCFVIAMILFFAFAQESTDERRGLYMCIFVFLAIGSLTFPCGPYIRPHPIFWRLVFGVSVIYCLVLVFLLFQTPMGARESLKWLDPQLGVKLPERSYATDCELSWNAIVGVMDRFVFAHFLGWLVKALIIRSWVFKKKKKKSVPPPPLSQNFFFYSTKKKALYTNILNYTSTDRSVLWISSILWEIVELSTKYFIPNFAECWWDQWILDVLICNGGGIELGLYLIRYLEMQEYEFHSVFHYKTIAGKFKRFALQFTPFKLDPIQWEPRSSIKRWFHMHLVILLGALVDMNAFLLKLWLWIPTEHSINLYRSATKIGSQLWILILIVVLELALIVKVAPTFPTPPVYNVKLWILGFVAYALFSFVMLRTYRGKHAKKN